MSKLGNVIEGAMESLAKGNEGREQPGRSDAPGKARDPFNEVLRDSQAPGKTLRQISVDGEPAWEAGIIARLADARQRITTRSVELDFKRLDSLGILNPENPSQRVAEELRIIKRRLLINTISLQEQGLKNGNVIMVTSSMPGEGKSFLAINLAISIAMEIDRTAFLIDADPTKASVSHVLGIGAGFGLSDLLSNPNLDLADTLLKTNIEKLKILPSGKRLRDMTEYLASRKTELVMEELARKYHDRIIIIDSPPLLATTEAAVLQRMAGQIIVVVEAERTKRSDLQTALSLLDEQKKIGLVLNKTTERQETNYYEAHQRLQKD